MTEAKKLAIILDMPEKYAKKILADYKEKGLGIKDILKDMEDWGMLVKFEE